MKKFLQKTKDLKALGAVLFIMLLFSTAGWGQQVIGQFPTMDGGFEAQTGTLASGSIATNTQRTAWTHGATSTVVNATGGRSGSKYITSSYTSTTATGTYGSGGHVRVQSPTTAINALLASTTAPPVTNTYMVQFYYKLATGGASTGSIRAGVSPDGTTGANYNNASSHLLNVSNAGWLKYSVAVASKTGVQTYGVGIIDYWATTASTTVSYDFDDFVVYAGSTADGTPPDTPTTAVAGVDSSIAAQLTVNWTAPSTGVDGGGYVVVRYASAPFAENDPNANGIYSIGNTFSSGVTNTLTGKVVYVGTGTSFIDSGLTASSTYYYKVYAVDKAFNYSTELTPSAGVTYISGTTSAVGNSSTTYYFVPTSGTNINSLSNWFPNADGTGANPIDFSAANTTFNMYNSGTTTAAWALGSGSKIVVGNGTVATTLTIASGFPLTGGAVDVSAGSKLVIAGGVAPTFGTLNLTSTVEISAGTTTQISAGTFGNLTASGAGTIVTQTVATVINGDLTITGGALYKFDNSVTNRNITVGGNFVASGSGGIDAINGSSTNQIILTGTGKSINNTATGNLFNKSFLNITGTYTLGADFKYITNLNNRTLTIGASGSLNLNGYKFSLDNNLLIPIIITAGGQLIANGAGSTVEFFGNTTLQSIPTSVNYNNLIITGGSKAIDAGTLSVAGNLTVNTGATFNGATNNPTVNIGGAFSNAGTFTQGTGLVTFNGGSAQTFANTGTCAFNNLTLNNSTGLTISNNLNVNGALTFTSGNITTGANAVVLGAAGSVARTSGYVAGNFTKNLTTSTTSVNYEIGGASTYRPVALVFGAITSPGTLTASVSQTAGAHPQLATSLLDPNKRVNNYFTLSSSALAFSTADATFNFASEDVVNSADTNSFIVQKYASSSWSSATVGTKTSTSTQVTGIDSFGDFAIGEASPVPLLTNSAMASFGNVCVNTSSSANSFTITGANLSADDVTVGPATGYTFSTNNADYSSSLSLTQAGGSYSQLVYVKFNPTTIQSNVSIPVAGGGATSISVATTAAGVNTAVAVSAGSTSVLPTSATVSSTYTAGCSTVLAYGVEYSTTSGFSNGSGNQVAGSGGAAFTAAISSLSPNTTYYYKTYATDGTGTIYSSSQSSFITANLNAPVASAATAITSSGFTANWSAVTGATNYLLNVYTAATENIVGWTFPLSGATVTADIVSTNNSTNTLTTVTTAITDAVGVTNRAALTTTWGTVGKYWEVSVNTTGYRAIKVSSAQQSSSSGPKDFKLQYRIGDNTGAFSDVLNGSIIVPNGTYSALDNLILPDACNNQSVVYLRWTTTSTLRADQTTTPGATIASGGTNRIDNIIITGGKMTYLTGYNPKTVTSATTYDVTGVALGSTYYYDVRANATSSTSAVSNAISLTILADETVADYRSKQSGDFSSVSTWEFNDATQWLTATTTPTSANNITIVSGHEVTLTAPISVASTKAITVNGTINLAGNNVSGLGSFVLSAAASIKLGNIASLATAITTSTITLNAAANYFYDGTTLQNTTSLPATVTGNVTISNNTNGVMMAAGIKINSPGTLSVSGKLFMGNGNVVDSSIIGSGTFSYTGTGNFSAATGSTLSITSSKGICTGTASGGIKNSGTRAFANGINYIFAKNDLANAINMGTSFGSSEISATLGINNLTIANPLGVYLPGAIQAVNAGGTSVTDFVPDTDITVNGVLNFVSGALVANNGANLTTTVNGVTTYSAVPQSTGTKTVTIGTSGSITGTGSSTGWVIGNLKKLTNSGASPSFTYTIGDATYYTPLAVTFTGNTSANGGLTARTTAGDHAQISSSDILPNKSINRTWTLTNASLADFTDYSATFTYATDDNDSSVVLTYFGSRLYNGSSWSSLTTSGTPTSTSLTATSISTFGDFAIGQICNNPTSGGTISGTQSFCGIGNPADLMSASSATGFTGVLEYQWQKSTDNINFTDVTDATAINYSPTAGLSVTTYYRRLARVDCKSSWTGAASSNVITVTVTPVVTPTFTQVAPICLGTTLSALPTTSNNGVTGSWSPSINSAATTLYTFTPSADICADSATMSITVNQSVAGTISGNQTITTGTTPTNISLSNYTGNIQWQSSTNGTNFSNINGATNATLSGATIGALTVNTYIRAVVTNGSCASANSDVSTITITCCKFKFSSN